MFSSFASGVRSLIRRSLANSVVRALVAFRDVYETVRE